jgi:hypothetical protein
MSCPCCYRRFQTPLKTSDLRKEQPVAFKSHAQNVRSRVRYWIASAMCPDSIASVPDRSAMVRATFRTRSCAPGTQPLFGNRSFQQVLRFPAQVTIFPDFARAHLGVRVE